MPPLLPGQPPLAILVDYDGTIARTDVSDSLLAQFVTADWEAHVAEYDAGLIGSRRLMTWEVGLIDADEASLHELAAAQPHDETFRPFAERARAAGIPVEIVSDGFGSSSSRRCARSGRAGCPWSRRRPRSVRWGRITFPNGNPDCLVCGTCKRNACSPTRRRAGRWCSSGTAVGPVRGGVLRRGVREARAGPDLPRQRLGVRAVRRLRRGPPRGSTGSSRRSRRTPARCRAAAPAPVLRRGGLGARAGGPGAAIALSRRCPPVPAGRDRVRPAARLAPPPATRSVRRP